MTRQTYATDITESEWRYLEPYLPAPKSGGRPRRHAVREILNAIFYVLRSGCAWRLLPHDLPPWKTVYHYFRLWRLQGLWDKLHAALYAAARLNAGRPLGVGGAWPRTAHNPQRLPGVAAPLGRGTHLCVAGHVPALG